MKRFKEDLDLLIDLITFGLLVAVCLLLLTSCGAPEKRYSMRPSVIHPELVGMVDEFLDEAEARGLLHPGLPFPEVITFRDMEQPERVGECWSNGTIGIAHHHRYDGAPRIRATVFHELAHCMFDVGHEPLPGFVMSAWIPYDAPFNWPMKVEQLFSFVRATSPLLHEGD